MSLSPPMSSGVLTTKCSAKTACRGAHAKDLYDTLCTLPVTELERRQQMCERSFLHQGITFTVYGDEQATEKIIPTDLLPRIVPGASGTSSRAG